MNKNRKTSTLLILLFTGHLISLGQASEFFVSQGDNVSEVSCGGILFAMHANQNFLATNKGSVWLKKQIDLSQPFNTSFTLDLVDALGMDGGAFVFQTDPHGLGESEHGLGFRGLTPSVAVTFDLVPNSSQHDPAFRHIAIQANGDLDHSSPNNLAGPVSIAPLFITTTYPPPDPPLIGFRHLVTIDWDPGAKKLSVYIDNVLVTSAIKDLVQTIFNGNSIVYWGFTSSNTQLTWYPANSELSFGHMHVYFGQITTRFVRVPETDSCFAGPVQFFDSSVYSSGNGTDPLAFVKWYWDFGDGTNSNVRNPPPHQYATAGNYSVKFAITNSSGCSYDTLIKKIALGSKPRVDFTATHLCTNSDIQFLDKTKVDVGTPVEWLWTFDNGRSTDQDATARFTTPGLHVVTLSVRTEYVCRADTTITLVVNEKPLIDFSFTKDCFANVQYQSMLSNNALVDSWQWDFGDGRSSRQPDAFHFFASDGNYATKLLAASGDCTSDTIVKAIAISRVRAFAGHDTIAVRNQPIQLNATGGSIYEWQPHIFLSNAFAPDPVALLPADQSYILIVRNADGCEARDTLKIRVFDHFDVYVPTAFTPNNDGRNDILHLVAPGLKQLFYFQVYSRWGQKVFETSNPSQGWDGRVGGQLSTTGVYVWLMKGVDYLGNPVERKGTVTLLR